MRLAEAAWWTLATVALAVAFGALLAVSAGGTAAGQFFAGWLTEYSLSLDNLLVFIILIGRSKVPRQQQSRVVLAGILLALLLRGVVIALGAAALHKFGWVEYLFGAFLLYTAAEVARQRRSGRHRAAFGPTAALEPAGGRGSRTPTAGGPAARPLQRPRPGAAARGWPRGWAAAGASPRWSCWSSRSGSPTSCSPSIPSRPSSG